MATHKRKQADSLFLDIPYVPWSTIDATWSNWTGLWTIRASLDTSVLLSGSLIRSDEEGIYNLRIGPATIPGWDSLPPGQYVLSLEINNTAADFRREVQDKLIIDAQGVPNA